MAIDPANIGELVDSMPACGDATTLRERATSDGYLFFRGLIDRDKVLGLRRQFAAILADIGWLKPGTEPVEAIAGRASIVEGNEEFRPVFDRFQRLEDFHLLSHDPALLDVLERLFGEPVLAHPRNIGRIMFPDTPTTPPHQDYLHIRGTDNTYTAWLPLGDAPRTLGGLAVLPGTHKLGLMPTRAMPGAGGAGIEDDRLRAQWLTTDYRAGDVILLHSLLVHASLPNQTGERMRLSVDYRYQPASEPVHPSSLKPHFARFDWDSVYAEWSERTKPYQRYWEKLDLRVTEQSMASGGGGY